MVSTRHPPSLTPCWSKQSRPTPWTRYLGTDLDFADRAKVDDGFYRRQAVMLAGALRHTPMRGEFLSYEVPSYFGMLVAAYAPA